MIFSKTLERKHSIVIGLKSVGDEGVEFFLNGNMCVLFQVSGKISSLNDVLNRLTRRSPSSGRALTITLCGMPSSSLAYEVKCDVAKITSARVTGAASQWFRLICIIFNATFEASVGMPSRILGTFWSQVRGLSPYCLPLCRDRNMLSPYTSLLCGLLCCT